MYKMYKMSPPCEDQTVAVIDSEVWRKFGFSIFHWVASALEKETSVLVADVLISLCD